MYAIRSYYDTGRHRFQKPQRLFVEQVSANFKMEVAAAIPLQNKFEDFPATRVIIVESAIDKFDLLDSYNFV